ncbi:MAG: hypothetical protein U9Q68_10890 [Euryarchaeota archaeon]|nr:hypothetical protein [Euryarchaeota archaeon]
MVEFKAYADSGAGYSVFHGSVIEILGLELEDGYKEYVTVGDGSLIPVYMHRIVVQLALEEFDGSLVIRVAHICTVSHYKTKPLSFASIGGKSEEVKS